MEWHCRHISATENYKYKCKHSLTTTATVLLIAAVHAVRVGVTPPADGYTVSVLTLELVILALQITTML